MTDNTSSSNMHTGALINMMNDGLLLVDSTGHVIEANRAAVRWLGDKITGSHIDRCFGQDDVSAAFHAVISDDGEEELVFRPNGSVRREFRLRIRRLSSEQVAIMMFDMTLQRNLEAVRRDFVANVSHELRSPLTSLAGFIETMMSGDVTDEAMRTRFLGIMDEEAKRMSRLIDDLLSLSRVEVEEHIVPDKRLALITLISGVCDSLAGSAKARGMSIVIEKHLASTKDAPEILGNNDEITGVFMNLIENAVKYGAANTQITITISMAETNTIQIDVTNLGEGIAAHHLSRLTERFYRVDKARSRQIGGTGLGLAIVKHIVNRHRGQLAIQSTVGESTTFSVVLPMA